MNNTEEKLTQEKLNLLKGVLCKSLVFPQYKGKIKKIELSADKSTISLFLKYYYKPISGKWVRKPCPSKIEIDLADTVIEWEGIGCIPALCIRNSIHGTKEFIEWDFFVSYSEI